MFIDLILSQSIVYAWTHKYAQRYSKNYTVYQKYVVNSRMPKFLLSHVPGNILRKKIKLWLKIGSLSTELL